MAKKTREKKLEQEPLEDRVLRRMLETPPKPHKPIKKRGKPTPKRGNV